MSILKQLSSEKKFKLIGEIASLMISSDLHVHYSLQDIRDIFLPAVDCNQFKIYYNQKKLPVGFICWAFLTDEIDKLYQEGKYKIKPTDWNSGENGWLIELIAPFGHGKKIISELKHDIFPDKEGKALVFSKDKKDLKVIKIRGAKVKRSKSPSKNENNTKVQENIITTSKNSKKGTEPQYIKQRNDHIDEVNKNSS